MSLHNEYRGWRGDSTADVQLDAASLSPEAFWRAHVAPRRPALIRELLADLKATLQWTDEHFVKHAGAASVEVEQRGSASEGFGRGRKVTMPFGELVRRAAAGDERLYLSTQQAAVGADGHAEVVSSPLAELCAAGEVPLQPALTGNLVPQQLNLWMGAALQGVSSGLHHDFHDNLYLLLRGRKRLRLFPPCAVDRMYTYGRPRRVHPNGRIVYAGQGDVLADGSSAADLAAWERRRAVDAAAACESIADAALDDALDAALDHFAGRSGGGSGDGRCWEAEALDDYEDSDGGSASPEPGSSTTQDGSEPPSFSRIDLAAPEAQLWRSFPRFPGMGAAMETPHSWRPGSAGEALFLPAGWFHEVTSFSDGAATHAALNYWFHPPDNLDPGPEGFAAPYTTGFWPAVWANRCRQQRVSSAATRIQGQAAGAHDSEPAPVQSAVMKPSGPHPRLISRRWQRRLRCNLGGVATGGLRRQHLALFARPSRRKLRG